MIIEDKKSIHFLVKCYKGSFDMFLLLRMTRDFINVRAQLDDSAHTLSSRTYKSLVLEDIQISCLQVDNDL